MSNQEVQIGLKIYGSINIIIQTKETQLRQPLGGLKFAGPQSGLEILSTRWFGKNVEWAEGSPNSEPDTVFFPE